MKIDLNAVCKGNTLTTKGFEYFCNSHKVDYSEVDSYINDIMRLPFYEFDIYELLDFIHEYAKKKALMYHEFKTLGFDDFKEVVTKLVKLDCLCPTGRIEWARKWAKDLGEQGGELDV